MGSHYDYVAAYRLQGKMPSFHVALQVAMRLADDENAAKLAHVFPEVWEELNRRIGAPGGYLPHEIGPLYKEEA